MLPLLLIGAAAPLTQPQPDQARRIVEWQLRAPPRTEAEAQLSPAEAGAIADAYLRSIGQRLDAPQNRRPAP
ncbi:hypothetical protein [Sphingobium bisphenolivorans]|uniref:hypothetical protein n=1 Tax=Sphingobium bisphenolivorans TaxID=1335760 RepID=UPI00039EF5C1|nr:hypothetical protein [Sphingobium bisphenolivorans]